MKKYAGTTSDAEKKLARVMERLGAKKYQMDWSNSRSDTLVWVEMVYKTSTYRFENSASKSLATGRGLTSVSDLLFSIVYSLEGLARAVEQGIFTLDMLMKGVPALPAAKSLPECYRLMGFTKTPTSTSEIDKKYRELAKQMHPDAGGSDAAFSELCEAYYDSIKLFKGEDY